MPTDGSGDGRIQVSGLTKQYKRLRAVDNLSFTVEPGRVTGFLGPNGSGKTTTLRMILNLVTPTAGGATIGGRRYSHLGEPSREVGAVLEASSAHRGRSGRGHLRIIAAAAGLPDSRVAEVLEMTALTPAAKRKFKAYSLGMRQRLGIAAAMLGDPRVLILDEPANGLDPEGIRWMREFLRALADQGRTILVSSHLLAEMELLADDLIIIANGRLIRQGTVEEVVKSSQTGVVVHVRTPQPAELVAAVSARGGLASSLPDGRIAVAGLEAAGVGNAAFTAGVELHELTTERPDLEGVFLELTQGQAAIR